MTTFNAEVFDSVAIKDYLFVNNGKLKITDSLTANGTANCSVTNVAPAAVGTSTISAWLEIDVASTKYYIPLWT